MALISNVVQGSDSTRLAMLVHGYGADERDLGGLLGYLDPDGKYTTVLPRGPVAAPPGFSWFDMAAQDPDEFPDEATVRFDRTKASLRRTPPKFSEHTKSVLAEFGYSTAEVDGLIAKGVVCGPERKR